MIRILFVCYGNICRSPMAEAVLRDLASGTALSSDLLVDSAATSPCNTGSGIYREAARALSRHGGAPTGHRARPLRRDDYDRFDLLIGMDHENVREMRRICGGDPAGKIRLLLDFADRPGEEVDDPWYTGDYEAAWRDIDQGCRGLLRSLTARDP